MRARVRWQGPPRRDTGWSTWSIQVRFFFSSSLSQTGGWPSLVSLRSDGGLRRGKREGCSQQDVSDLTLSIIETETTQIWSIPKWKELCRLSCVVNDSLFLCSSLLLVYEILKPHSPKFTLRSGSECWSNTHSIFRFVGWGGGRGWMWVGQYRLPLHGALPFS